MGELLSYSLTASVIILVLFPVLHQIINRSTNFRFNRAAILCGLLISLTLPFIYKVLAITFPMDVAVFNSEDINMSPTLSVTQAVINNSTRTGSGTFSFQWLPTAIVIYFSGIIFLFIRETISFIRLFKILSQCEKRKTDGLILCRITDNIVSPFSWGNYIFLTDSEFDNLDCIYIHEKAHADKKHWLDIILADLFCILLWYNPLSWMTKRLMKLNHEFDADSAVIRSGIDKYEYQRLLIVKAMGRRSFPVANGFAADNRRFRKRVLIMNKRHSSKKTLLIAIFAIPSSVLACMSMSMPIPSKLLSEISDYSFYGETSSSKLTSDLTSHKVPIENAVRETYPDTATIIPSPIKDQAALNDIIKFSIETIQFKKNTKVNVEIVVDEDGKVKDVITDSPGGADIATAIEKNLNGIRFEQMSDNGRPVKVHFNVPIQIEKTK